MSVETMKYTRDYGALERLIKNLIEHLRYVEGTVKMHESSWDMPWLKPHEVESAETSIAAINEIWAEIKRGPHLVPDDPQLPIAAPHPPSTPAKTGGGCDT